MSPESNIPNLSNLSASIGVTFPEGSNNDFAWIRELTEARLSTQFHDPKITVVPEEQAPTASSHDSTRATVTVEAGPLRNPEPAEYREAYFKRAVSAFESLLGDKGFETSRLEQAGRGFERQ